MIRYRRDPNGGAAFVEAEPADVMALAPAIRARLAYRWGVQANDAEDLTQDTVWVTIRALQEGRIRETHNHAPRHALLGFMFAVAWNLRQNYRVRFRHTHEVPANDRDLEMFAEDENADERLAAREILAKLQAYPEVLALLLTFANKAPKASYKTNTVDYQNANRARRWIRQVWKTGLWQDPPMPQKPTPWKRKGKR